MPSGKLNHRKVDIPMRRSRKKLRTQSHQNSNPKQKKAPNGSLHRNRTVSARNTRTDIVKIGIKAGVIAAAMGLIGYCILKDGQRDPAEVTTEEYMMAADPDPDGRDIKSRRMELINSANLPEFSLSKAPITIQEAGFDLPPGIDEEKLNASFEKFKSDKSKFMQKLSGISNHDEREALINQFFNDLIMGNRVFIEQLNRNLGLNVRENIRVLNKLFMRYGVFIDLLKRNGENNFVFSFYDVEKIRKLSINLSGASSDINCIFVKNREVVTKHPSDHNNVLFGEYFKGDKYLVLSLDAARKGFDEQFKFFADVDKMAAERFSNSDKDVMQQDFLHSTMSHEVMHVALREFFGIESKSENISSRNTSPISDFIENTRKNTTDTELHELAAHGYGLMSSGKTAKIQAIALLKNKNPKYRLAQIALIIELMRLNKTGDAANTLSKTLVYSNVEKFVYLMDDDKLHKIGERMAKLGIFIAQRVRKR